MKLYTGFMKWFRMLQRFTESLRQKRTDKQKSDKLTDRMADKLDRLTDKMTDKLTTLERQNSTGSINSVTSFSMRFDVISLSVSRMKWMISQFNLHICIALIKVWHFNFQPLVEQTADKVSKIKDTIIKGAGGIFSRGANVSGSVRN